MDGGPSAADIGQLRPSRFLTFLLPNPDPTSTSPYASLLRVAVLDSPIFLPQPPRTAAMHVPLGRESDWIFSTAEGHLQLLFATSLGLSRLLLIGNPPVPSPLPTYTRPSKDHHRDIEDLEARLLPFVVALCPKSAFVGGIPSVPFLSYDDDVVRIVPVETAVGSVVGEMLVEEAELQIENGDCEVRRRLRFRRLPNLVQTQVRVTPHGHDDLLVQPYLRPMVAGICLIGASLEEKSRSRPRALCLGVGGGSLLMCLRSQLGFDVLGVEEDKVVLDVAKRHFGLVEDEFLRVCVADGINIMKSFCHNGEDQDIPWEGCVGGVDVVMVDLDSADAATGLTAPPVEFIKGNVLAGARRVLQEKGILVVNVVPQDVSLHTEFVSLLRQVFSELYEIDVGNAENLVIVAAASTVGCLQEDVWDSPLKEKLKEIVGQRYIDCIRKI